MAQSERPRHVSRFLANEKEVASGLMSQIEKAETQQQRRATAVAGDRSPV